MDREIHALRQHAAFCRHVAAETTYETAAHRLWVMALEYECRAQDLANRGATSTQCEIMQTPN